jgi:hypothetical protein
MTGKPFRATTLSRKDSEHRRAALSSHFPLFKVEAAICDQKLVKERRDMTHHGRTTRNVFAAVAVTLMMTAFSLAQQYSEKPIYTFTESRHGAIGGSQLVSDSAGNLYGTTIDGGNKSTSCAVQTGVPGCGVVFKLTPTGKETVLHIFTGKDGALPYGGVILDSAGNLYGVALAGGDKKPKVCHYLNLGGFPPGCGVVFKLTPTAQGPWKYKVLYTFTGGKGGAGPFGGVVFDSGGNLYGAGGYGGDKPTACKPYGCGVVFKLTPTANGPWTESVLYRFVGVKTGFLPVGVTFDSEGNLYGVTYVGGDKSVSCVGLTGCGVVFKLTPRAHGLWKETVLHAFTNSKDGGLPQGIPFVDPKDNVYGTTVYGGVGYGVVYKLTPHAHGAWKEAVLHTFTGGSDGGLARASVIFDSAGNLYSTTVIGGDSNCNGGGGCGVVFKLTPRKNDQGPWTERPLYKFTRDTDGGVPQSNLLFDAAGDIFGMTTGGGNDSECLANKWGGDGCGVVFELTP